MRKADLNDLLVQARITNRLLAAQLRSSLSQKELVNVLMSVGATHGEIADVLDTTAATVEVTVRRLRKSKTKAPSSKTRRRRAGGKNG
jgi:DNA-binding CsgD family transcriptional regulator